jgi:hypothetical protein
MDEENPPPYPSNEENLPPYPSNEENYNFLEIICCFMHCLTLICSRPIRNNNHDNNYVSKCGLLTIFVGFGVLVFIIFSF